MYIVSYKQLKEHTQSNKWSEVKTESYSSLQIAISTAKDLLDSHLNAQKMPDYIAPVKITVTDKYNTKYVDFTIF